ncbi:MAG TPA: ABC transporter, partial [Flavobacteriales bacterium]|nr:ABC transporter [Flavobacteriales bacterium]
MNYLSVENLVKTYGERTLFKDISFGLAKGDKVALIANNGTGKSTLLRILAGQDVADGGEFSFRDGIRVSFLEQEPVLTDDDNITIEAFVREASAEVLAIIRDYEAALENSMSGEEEHLKALERTSILMDAREAWDFDRRLETMLGRFGIHDLNQKVNSLSGGQKKRLAIAITVLDQPEFLILDEPT